MSQPGLERVRLAAPNVYLEPTDRRGIFGLAPVSFGLSGLDAVLTFRNLHNLTPEARANLHRAVFAALRPDGVYGVVDHTRRHMQPDDPENRRLAPWPTQRCQRRRVMIRTESVRSRVCAEYIE